MHIAFSRDDDKSGWGAWVLYWSGSWQRSGTDTEAGDDVTVVALYILSFSLSPWTGTDGKALLNFKKCHSITPEKGRTRTRVSCFHRSCSELKPINTHENCSVILQGSECWLYHKAFSAGYVTVSVYTPYDPLWQTTPSARRLAISRQ